jgi:hypothetical protein
MKSLKGYKTHLLVAVLVGLGALQQYQAGQLMDLDTLKQTVELLVISTFREGLKAL